jgi:uncharacterized membrane protein
LADEDLTAQPSRSGDSPRPRIQTLSDLIFGLALSIGAITLLSQKPTGLLDLVSIIVTFGFSFLILSTIWLRYTRIMSALPLETGRMGGVNMLLLFLVSIEPYLFNLIGSDPTDRGNITAVYAVDLGSMNLILAYFTHVLTMEQKNLIPKSLLRTYRLQRTATIIIAAVVLVSALPQLDTNVFGLPLRFALWTGTFATYLVRWKIQPSRKPD